MRARPSLRRRVARWTAPLAVLLGVGGVLSAAPAQAAPAFGDIPLVVLACRFSDTPSPSQLVSTLRARVLGPGDSLDARVRALSGDHASLVGAAVRGWYRMPLRAADRPSVPQVVTACRDAAAAAGVALAATDRLLVVVNSDAYRPETTEPNGTVIDHLQPIEAWQHALGHVLGLRDAWSWDPATREYRVRDDEYSVMGSFRRRWPTLFRNPTPTLNAYELDRLSWLDQSRIVTAGADGRATTTVDLAPLDPSPIAPTTDKQLIRVPFDRFDPEHYYAVSVRAYQGDNDLPSSYGGAMLIHEIVNGVPVLLRDNSIPEERYPDTGELISPARPPLESLSLNGVTITRIPGAPWTSTRVVVTTPVVTQCLAAYGPRLARPQDAVCVPGTRITATAEANRLAPTRWVDGPFGPHTCVQGYVWREAFSGDDVCVTPAERSTVAEENRTARDRVNPARLTVGPNWCTSGYVWREADRTDPVCVTPSRRTEIRAETIGTTGLDVPCPQFTTRRRAWPGDLVCSTVASRSLVAFENAQAPTRVRPG